jgi:signal transduction histidine kinase
MYNKDIVKDIEKIRQISIVPTILEVICNTTGMGFSAVARVTNESWVACSIRDEIDFGLKPGGELRLETTICNEIRTTRQPVVIDHVEEDPAFCSHHTPAMYGFQSYISVPIILKSGELFGTLCAIDPRPALLKDSKTTAMFNLFAELIAFHLESLDKLEQSNVAIMSLDKQLSETRDENRQYKFISKHNLQEPLRKLRVFSSILSEASDRNDLKKVKIFAEKINQNAQRFSMMVKDLSDLSELDQAVHTSEEVNLNTVLADVCLQLESQIEQTSATVQVGKLPVIHGVTLQMEQLFYHLITNALKFSRPAVPPNIIISSLTPDIAHVKHMDPRFNKADYTEIRISDNGVGIVKPQLEKIFDIFAKLDYDPELKSAGVGLTYCRKIVRNHGGIITAESEAGEGTTFNIFFPQNRVIGWK